MSQGKKTTIIAEPGKQEITTIREYDAPRELVFKAYTDPELYVQWLGPRGYNMTLVQFEPRSGGSWRYTEKDTNGAVHGFHGVNHDVTAPERIIGTFEYEGLPEAGHVLLESANFQELPGKRTRVTTKSVFLTVEDRDGMIASGMEYGVQDSGERLDELLAKLAK